MKQSEDRLRSGFRVNAWPIATPHRGTGASSKGRWMRSPTKNGWPLPFRLPDGTVAVKTREYVSHPRPPSTPPHAPLSAPGASPVHRGVGRADRVASASASRRSPSRAEAGRQGRGVEFPSSERRFVRRLGWGMGIHRPLLLRGRFFFVIFYLPLLLTDLTGVRDGPFATT
jgi:hypothetical protein